MTTTISSKEMRERILRRMDASRTEASDWRKVIAVDGHRELLALIAGHRPESVADLARMTGRAQSNVSRSLAALVRAELITLQPEGRTTRPALTALGAEKVQALDLAPPELAPKAVDLQAEIPEGFIAVELKHVTPDTDGVQGDLKVLLHCADGHDRFGQATDKDLAEIGVRLLSDWWRVLYRRDAPYKVCELELQIKNIRRPSTLFFTSWGRNIEIVMREREPGPAASVAKTRVPLNVTERTVLDGLCRPLARTLRQHGRNDRPLHSLLARLESTLEQPTEVAFCRTAGALGLSPYRLDDVTASQVSGLMKRLPQEEARLDFASAVLDRLAESEAWMDHEETTKADSNRLPGLEELAEACKPARSEIGLRPWERGVASAKRMRKVLKLGSDMPVGGVSGLVEHFGGDKSFALSPPAPGALRAILSSLAEAPTVVVSGEHPVSTTFLLARAIGDYANFGDRRSCVADLYTDRQAVGRAFAAEFLAPADAVVRLVEEEDWSSHEIARHFGAPVGAVERQYRNNADQHG